MCMCMCRGIVEEGIVGMGIIKRVKHLNNEELLNVLSGAALAHAIPGRVRKSAAECPHDRDSGFSGIWALGLSSHFNHACRAARGAGRVVTHGGGSDALADEGGGDGGTDGETGEHVWRLRVCWGLCCYRTGYE
jgi:hypothetical protein